MKTKVFLSILLLALAHSVYGQQKPTTSVDKIPIVIRDNPSTPGRERTISFSTIEANLNRSEKTLELNLQGIGKADIYITDSLGNIREEDATWTDFPTTLTYDFSHLHGTLCLIISSPTHYGEGYFTL